MIHRLRRRHRRIWLALAVLLPVLCLVALAARRPAPLIDSLPEPLRRHGATDSPASGGASSLGDPASEHTSVEGLAS